MSRRTGSKLPSAMDYTKAFRRRHTAKPFSCSVTGNLYCDTGASHVPVPGRRGRRPLQDKKATNIRNTDFYVAGTSINYDLFFCVKNNYDKK